MNETIKGVALDLSNKVGWHLDNSYARLPELFFTKTLPTPVRAPELIILNDELAASLGLDSEALRDYEGLAVFAGNEVPAGALPLAQAYAGHQFGNFTMLGDGRAVLLGEQITPNGERFDVQLKGAGRTFYSRGGDGRAGLGPMLREYIISEAMHGLHIPTTRSLAVVTTGETVIRETDLRGAILTRVATSHLRVGTFEFAANWGTEEDLRTLADYAIKRHYAEALNDENRYLSLLQGVIKRQAELVAKWQLVGFIHGVMNTDNVTISGETIDYGPCAFMDVFDPTTVFSSIDRQARYAYGNQPNITGWNLTRFAEALLPLLDENEDEAITIAEDALETFTDIFQFSWYAGMRAKLGLFNEEKGDLALIKSLLDLMKKHRADYTNTFVALTFHQLKGASLFEAPEFTDWYALWQERLSRQEESKATVEKLMRNSNPAIIPRNHRVEEALEAAEKGDFTVMNRLLAALSHPYAHAKIQAEYATVPAATIPYKTFCGT